MAAEQTIPFGAVDWFRLDANKFVAQSSTNTHEQSVLWQFDHRAGPFSSNYLNGGNKAFVEYKYIGTNLANDLGTIATNLGQRVGSNIWQIDSVKLAFSAFSFPTVEISAHTHQGINRHSSVTFNWVSMIPNASASGIGFGGISGATAHAFPASAPGSVVTDFVMSASVTHLDIYGHDGLQSLGCAVSMRVSLSASGVGSLESIYGSVSGNWIRPTIEQNDSNSGHRGWKIEAETFVARN
ncbi:MAG: hypothetical protein OEQ18_00210 [Gammaproteobacteria bacterium]|nr:hypothetical protein [Gammaproteobacteria bacterium]